jgi:hypothetical protein
MLKFLGRPEILFEKKQLILALQQLLVEADSSS